MFRDLREGEHEVVQAAFATVIQDAHLATRKRRVVYVPCVAMVAAVASPFCPCSVLWSLQKLTTKNFACCLFWGKVCRVRFEPKGSIFLRFRGRSIKVRVHSHIYQR